MAIYPLPFEEIPSNYSFGKILLDIQIDHNSQNYEFVYRAQDRIGHVIRDEDDVSAYIGNYNGVSFRSTESQHDEQWEIDVLLGDTIAYDEYCQQNSVLRNPTSLTVLLDTKYNIRPVWSAAVAQTNKTNFCISSESVPNVNHGENKIIIAISYSVH